MSYFSGMVISQAVHGGLRIRNVDEIAELRAAAVGAFPPTTIIPGTLPNGLDAAIYGPGISSRDVKIVHDEKNIGEVEEREHVSNEEVSLKRSNLR